MRITGFEELRWKTQANHQKGTVDLIHRNQRDMPKNH